MTNKEAIETIKIAMAEVEWDYPMDYTVAFEMAIDALEKQIQKKVVEENLEKFKDGVWIPKKEYFCPTCKSNLGIKEKWRDITDYCPWCGQALSWGDCDEEG